MGRERCNTMQRSSVLVLMPVYNEGEALDRTLDVLKPVCAREQYDLVAVDDGSTDNSLAILRRHGVATISLIDSLGYGAALQAGFKYALAKGYEHLIHLDSDGQHDARFVPSIEGALAAHDFVIGSRFLEHVDTPFEPTRKLYRGTPLRRVGIGIHRLLLHAMSGVRVSDPTSGYIGMNRECIRLLSGDGFPSDYPDADVLLSLLRGRLRLREIPVYMYESDTVRGMHSGALMPAWYMLKVTLSLVVTALRRSEGGKRRS